MSRVWLDQYPGSMPGNVGQVIVVDRENKVGFNVSLENWGTYDNPMTAINVKNAIERFVAILEDSGHFEFNSASINQNTPYTDEPSPEESSASE